MESKVENIDCMIGMAKYPDKYFDLAIVDPEYGNEGDATKTFTSNSINRATKRKVYHQFKNNAPDENYFNELERVSKNQIIWGANFFGLIGGYICWNKNGTAFGEAELAWCSMFKSVRIIEITWNGMLQHDMKNKENRIHPTQKPVKLYKQLLSDYAEEGYKILDTHLGSGSSRIAAHDLGFDFTAFEIDSKFYNDQEKRYQNHIKQLTMF